MAAVALRTALERVGLPNAAATFAINQLGLDSLEAWRDLQVDEDLVGLAKNLRSPGGGHAGFQVSVLTIGRLKIMRLALKHHQLIQRPIAAPAINDEWINNWTFLVDYHASAKQKKPDEDDLPKINMTDWAKTKEIIISHFSECYGDGNIPLAYVLRENNAAPALAADPHDAYDGDTDRELITRAPHTGQYWVANNKAMCRLLKKICQDTPAYTYISNLRTDGRAAWRVLMQTYLGPQHTQLQAAIYEAKLQNSSYDGESQKFTYDKYCEIHQLAHTRLSSLEGQGYHGIDEGTKIRHFLQGIKTDKLKTTVELVRGNPDYTTFEAVAR